MNGGYWSTLQTQINNQITALSAQYQSVVSFLYTFIEEAGVSNLYWSNTPINYSILPPFFKFITQPNYANINQIVDYYVGQCNNFIEWANTNNYSLILSDKINLIIASYVNVDQLGKLIVSTFDNTTFTYVVPSPMSLRKAMSNNGLDFNTQIQQVLNLNLGIILSFNYVSPGTNLVLPKQ